MRRDGLLSMTLGIAAACCLLPAVVAVAAQSATPGQHETSAEVPALGAMHEVIYPLWHEAWPAKDVKKMAALLPEIEKHVAAVAGAQLPGILRDKQAAWKQGVAALQASVSDYRKAVQAGNTEALLEAAEQVHTDYEKLVRTIRPVTPEIEAFHQALYVLYHYDKDRFALPTVTTNVRILKMKMDALAAAALPARFKPKEADYTAARNALSRSVDALVAALDTSDEQKIKAAIDAVHDHYQALEQVFG
ncbi:MAG: hypothetical protein ACE148_03220 [Vicinamibacterales bacterium]